MKDFIAYVGLVFGAGIFFYGVVGLALKDKAEVVHARAWQVGDRACTARGPALIEGRYGPAKTKDPLYDVWDGKTLGILPESELRPCLLPS